MTIIDMFQDPLWDAPVFKILARNDTGEAQGHQGGMVIPKELRNYFPVLVGTTTFHLPTLEHRITADLFVDEEFVGTANARYQFQTWGNERAAESRLTDNLGPLRNKASAGDFLIIQRSINDLDIYKLMLVKNTNTVLFEGINELAKKHAYGKRWGLLTGKPPLSSDDLKKSEVEEKEIEQAPFNMFDTNAKSIDKSSRQVARSLVFMNTVLRIYNNKCCVCGESLISQKGRLGVNAAHIVSRALMGTDDARNGLCLCIRHHWAFDNGLYGINGNRKIHVSDWARNQENNKPIAELHGRVIIEASDNKLVADPSALKWHMDVIVKNQA